MSRGPGARVAVAAIAVICTSIGLTGAAPAETTSAGKFRYVQRSFSVGPTSQSTRQVARCPRGTHVYGGGMDAAQSFERGAVNSSFPVDLGDRGTVPDDGWAVYYDNYMQRRDDAKVTAVCGRVMPKYRSQRAPIGPRRFKTLTARCPRGTYVWGGGSDNSGPYFDFILSQTFPSGRRGWTSTISNFGDGSFRGRSWAICGTTKPRYVRESTIAIAEGSTLWDSDCPNQRFHLISGGGSHGAPGFIGLGTINPADGDGRVDAAPDDEMTVSFHNYTETPRRATVHAVCLR